MHKHHNEVSRGARFDLKDRVGNKIPRKNVETLGLGEMRDSSRSGRHSGLAFASATETSVVGVGEADDATNLESRKRFTDRLTIVQGAHNSKERLLRITVSMPSMLWLGQQPLLPCSVVVAHSVNKKTLKKSVITMGSGNVTDFWHMQTS